MSTSTIQVNFENLRARGAAGTIVIKLMMACNDLAVVNQALSDWKERRAAGDKSIRKGAGMYFLRAQISHLYEAFTLLEQLREVKSLMALLEACDSHTRDCFSDLQAYMRDGANHAEFQRLRERSCAAS